MKNSLLTLTAVAICILSSCKKPEACMSADDTNVNLGEEVDITNCSVGWKNADFDNGEGDTQDEDDFDETITAAFHTPGARDAELEVSNKSRKKKNSTTLTFNVASPEFADLSGSWEYYQYQEVLDLIWFIKSSPVPTTGTLEFLTSTTYEDDGNPGTYTLYPSSGNIELGSTSYSIYKLHNNELILKEAYVGEYTLHYFKR